MCGDVTQSFYCGLRISDFGFAACGGGVLCWRGFPILSSDALFSCGCVVGGNGGVEIWRGGVPFWRGGSPFSSGGVGGAGGGVPFCRNCAPFARGGVEIPRGCATFSSGDAPGRRDDAPGENGGVTGRRGGGVFSRGGAVAAGGEGAPARGGVAGACGGGAPTAGGVPGCGGAGLFALDDGCGGWRAAGDRVYALPTQKSTRGFLSRSPARRVSPAPRASLPGAYSLRKVPAPPPGTPHDRERRV